MSYFGGPCDSDQTGLSRGLRIHTINNNHVYIALMYIVYVGKINEILIFSRSNELDLHGECDRSGVHDL